MHAQGDHTGWRALAARVLLVSALAAGVGIAGSGSALTGVVIHRPASVALTQVSCASTTECLAIGDRHPSNVGQGLAESWDGASWTQVQLLPVFSELDGVACVRTGWCALVGTVRSDRGTYEVLSEAWTKGRMAPMTSPSVREGELRAVSCTSAAFCVAVGDARATSGRTYALVERWDGARWTVVRVPSPGTDSHLLSVSCSVATSCVAVGYDSDGGRAFADVWNGARWSITHVLPQSPRPHCRPGVPCPPPLPELARSISCSAPRSCITLVGLSVIAHWDGTRWRTLGPPKRDLDLTSVSCLDAGTCFVVGSRLTAPSGPPVVFELVHGRWRDLSLLPRRTPRGVALPSIDCLRAARCVAVGSNARPARACGGGRCWTVGVPFPVAGLWNGHTWITAPTHEGLRWGPS